MGVGATRRRSVLLLGLVCLVGADGTVVGTGRSQGFQLRIVQPGEWAIDHVFFDKVLPVGATTDFMVTGEALDRINPAFQEIPVQITETSLVQGKDSPRIVGVLENPSDETVWGTSLMPMCFDGSTPVTARLGYSDGTAGLAPGRISSFTVELLYTEACPSFALGGSGSPKS